MNDVAYIVVYQMGKVASTSLVATLNTIEGVTAVQSHFLGEAAFGSIAASLVSPHTPDYFFKHNLGQLVANIHIARRINLMRAAPEGEALVILSLARDPIEWFRSSLVQDIEGYLPAIRGIAGTWQIEHDDEALLVRDVMERLIGAFASILDAMGGIDPCVTRLRTEYQAVMASDPLLADARIAQIFSMMLRPFSWFEAHFERALGIRLDSMTQHDRAWSLAEGRHHFVIIRYEDLPGSFSETLRKLGIPQPAAIQSENTSEAKAFATPIRDAFISPSGQRLAAIAGRSRYARRFQYRQAG